MKKGLLIDTTYASAQLDRNSETGSDGVNLSPGARSGVCLKIQNVGPSNSGDGQRFPMTVIGEVYPK